MIHSKKVKVDGMIFDSEWEYTRWCELKILEREGLIRNLKRQVKLPLIIDGRPVKTKSEGYPNGRRASYKVDFGYDEMQDDWVPVLEERKPKVRIRKGKKPYRGSDTEASRLRRAVVEAIYNVEIRVT